MTNQQLLEKLKEDNINYLKYVRLHDNTLRFATTDYFALNHKNLVSDTEKPISAAYVRIKQRPTLEIETQEYSTTLNLGPLPDDETLIKTFIENLFMNQPCMT